MNRRGTLRKITGGATKIRLTKQAGAGSDDATGDRVTRGWLVKTVIAALIAAAVLAFVSLARKGAHALEPGHAPPSIAERIVGSTIDEVKTSKLMWATEPTMLSGGQRYFLDHFADFDPRTRHIEYEAHIGEPHVDIRRLDELAGRLQTRPIVTIGRVVGEDYLQSEGKNALWSVHLVDPLAQKQSDVRNYVFCRITLPEGFEVSRRTPVAVSGILIAAGIARAGGGQATMVYMMCNTFAPAIRGPARTGRSASK
jgi:hypothetical protein